MSRMWLIGGGIFVAVLLVASIAIALTQKEEVFADGTPERTVQLYLKALEDEDYTEAYGYLGAELRDGCTVDEFARDGAYARSTLGQNRVTLRDTDMVAGAAVVTLRVAYVSSDGLFGSGQYSSDYVYRLRQESGQWRFTEDPQWPFVGCMAYREPKPLPVVPVTPTPRPSPTPSAGS
ncbi:MAG: hypothetical protein FJ319_10750 [SAR202 cluster bacterium]|nr:hypothetical protein [SAR202 cluster bacterium]